MFFVCLLLVSFHYFSQLVNETKFKSIVNITLIIGNLAYANRVAKKKTTTTTTRCSLTNIFYLIDMLDGMAFNRIGNGRQKAVTFITGHFECKRVNFIAI